MSTVPINCPNCNQFLRVAIQPSRIVKNKDSLEVTFHDQVVAHVCKEKK